MRARPAFHGTILMIGAITAGTTFPCYAQQRTFDLPSMTVIEAYLDSVTSAALTASEHGERLKATIGVASVGRYWRLKEAAGTPMAGYPQVVRRLRMIYERTDDESVRSDMVRWMDLQPERQQAVAFLKDVARHDRPEDRRSEWPVPSAALDALARMGPEGQQALQQLAAEGSVRNGVARARLKQLEERGWRLDPPR